MGIVHKIIRSPLGFTAVLSVAALAGVSLWQATSFVRNGSQALAYVAPAPAQIEAPSGADWQQELAVLGLATTDDPSAANSDNIAMIGQMVVAAIVGEYAGLQSKGTYSAQDVQSASAQIAANIRVPLSYKTYAVGDITTDDDISYARMLRYRSDLREALTPLLKNTGSELDLYGKYIETSDASYLSQLSSAAQNYHAAADNAAALSVPKDAVNYHRDILNAMQKFAVALEQLVAHAGDALASAALLREYNQAETDMYTSFNALSAYYSQKTP